MTEIIVAQNAPVLVAIDIAKARHEVLIAIPDKKRRRRLTVLNELADINRLHRRVEGLWMPSACGLRGYRQLLSCLGVSSCNRRL